MLSISSKLPRLQADRETRLPVVHLDGLHSGFQLTVMHEGDAPATYDALRYTSVASMLSTAPEPYTLADAEHFHVRFRKPTTERVRAVSESVDWNTADEAAIRKALEQIGCDTLPLTAIRDGTTGRLVGSVAWRRNAWEQWTTADPARRAELLARNAALPRGHDDVTYSFGEFDCRSPPSSTLLPPVLCLGYADSHVICIRHEWIDFSHDCVLHCHHCQATGYTPTTLAEGWPRRPSGRPSRSTRTFTTSARSRESAERTTRRAEG